MRVLEFGDNVSAGYCGRLFRQYGAEVIRVDLPSPGALDDIELSLDVFLHSGKKRLALDYFADTGEELLRRLADESDVVVTDLLPRQLDTLAWSTFPGSLRVSITPFGIDGPYRNWQGNGSVLLAMGGYTYIIGDEDRAPLNLPMYYVEYQSAQFAYMAALASCSSSDACSDIEVSMLETVLSLSQWTSVLWTHQQRVRTRHGNRMGNLHPVSLYPCKDGLVYLTVVPTFWRSLVSMLGRDDLLKDKRFSTNTARLKNVDALDEIITEVFSKYTMAECLELGQRKHRIPIGAAMTLDQVLTDEHLKARHYWQEVVIPGRGTHRMPGSAFRDVPATPQQQLRYDEPKSVQNG